MRNGRIAASVFGSFRERFHVRVEIGGVQYRQLGRQLAGDDRVSLLSLIRGQILDQVPSRILVLGAAEDRQIASSDKSVLTAGTGR
ncbi:hypothetical protein D3C81_1376050 [compost metagenome]